MDPPSTGTMTGWPPRQASDP